MQIEPSLPTLLLLSIPIVISWIVIVITSGRERTATSWENPQIAQRRKEQREQPDKVVPKFDELFVYTQLAIEDEQRRSSNIYRTIVRIMAIGIIIILTGVIVLLFQPIQESLKPVTEWSIFVVGTSITIAAILLLIYYRPIFLQAQNTYQTLDRLIILGVSAKMFDSISIDNTASGEQKISVIEARAEIAKQLLLSTGELNKNRSVDGQTTN